MESAITRAAVVLASPGTLSSSTCPPASSPISSVSRRFSWPTTLAVKACESAASDRWACSMSWWLGWGRAAVIVIAAPRLSKAQLGRGLCHIGSPRDELAGVTLFGAATGRLHGDGCLDLAAEHQLQPILVEHLELDRADVP